MQNLYLPACEKECGLNVHTIIAASRLSDSWKMDATAAVTTNTDGQLILKLMPGRLDHRKLSCLQLIAILEPTLTTLTGRSSETLCNSEIHHLDLSFAGSRSIYIYIDHLLLRSQHPFEIIYI